MKKLVFLAAVFSAVLVFAVPAGALAASEAFFTTQLTSNSKSDSGPQVSGDRVVWGSYDGTSFEIFTWTPTGGTVRLVSSRNEVSGPEVSGDRVVWYGYDGHDDEIFTWTPASGTVQVTSNGTRDMMPEVSGDRIVWRGSDNTDYFSYVFTWTSSGGTVQITSTGFCNDGPQVSGERVAWVGTTGDYSGVFTWTPATGTVRLSDGGEFVGVSGDRVVWDAAVGGGTNMSSEIFTWTPAEGVVQITSNGYVDNFPRVSGDRVAWCGTGDSDWEAFTWTPADGVVRLTSNGIHDYEPKVSGDRVAWETRALSGWANSEIVVWTPGAGAVQVTSNSLRDIGPQISGDRVAWSRYDGTDYEIYTAVAVPITIPTITSVDPTSGPTTGDTTVTITGSGFLGMSGAFAVTFGGVNATSYTVDSPTKITAVAPAHAAGTVNVVVKALGGTSSVAGSGDDYTYVTRYQQTDSRLAYLGSWSTSTVTAASGGSFRFTDSSASVTVSFTGTYLAWLAKKSPVYGKAKVTLDGTTTFTVDLYSSSTLYRQSVWNTGKLVSGTHTVKIEWTGTKRTAASATNINLDAVDVIGVLR